METDYIEKIPTPNGPSVVEICVLVVGDDEHGGVLTVTGDAGILKTRLKGLTISERYCRSVYIGISLAC